MGKTAISIGLDIGGGSTKVGLIDASGNLLNTHRVVLAPGADFDEILLQYRAAIEALAGNVARLPIGIAYPGHIDRHRSIGLNSNVPALDGQPLAMALGTPDTPAALLNDADAAALAEAQRHPEGRDGRMLMITVGTGIGVAMTVGGMMLETAGGTLGDSGHIGVDPTGRHSCRQGCHGCLESVASAEALARDATARAAEGSSAALVRELATHGEVSAAAVCHAALTGDAMALSLVSQMADWLGMAVASWRAIFHPDLVVVGGGLSVLGPPFVEQIRARADSRSLPFLVGGCRFALAELGNDAGMVGAGLAALNVHQERSARV